MSVQGFDNIEDMLAFMRRNEEAANDRVTPDQAEIGYGAYWMRVDQEVVIFGYVPTEAEVEASERGDADESDEESEEEIAGTLEMLRDAHARGYRYGKCYSTWEPEGEWGSTHISVMVEISDELFNLARDQGWQLQIPS